MPTNTTNIQSAVNSFQVNQSLPQATNRQPLERAPESSQPEEIFTVEISQEALELARQAAEQKAAADQDLEQEKTIQREANQKATQENSETREQNAQQSVDLFV